MLNANPFFLFIYKETCFMIIQVYDLRPFFVYIKLKEREKKKKNSTLKEAVQYLILSQLVKNLKIPYWLVYQ